MSGISFRLLRIGGPGERGFAFPLWEERGRVVMRDLEYTTPLSTGKPLSLLTTRDLPDWLVRQGHPLTLSDVRTVEGTDEGEAFMRMMEAADAFTAPQPVSV